MITNDSWIRFISNRLSIDSLYTNPPNLDDLIIKSLHFGPHSAIEINFILDQLPDKSPLRGKWAQCKNVTAVDVKMRFLSVASISIEHINSSKYQLHIARNPDYVEKNETINDKYKVVVNQDKIRVELKNDLSQIIFFAYDVEVCSLKPIHN